MNRLLFVSFAALTASAFSQSLSPPSIVKTFASPTLALGETTKLTFTITNPNPAALTGTGFIETLPDGLVVATPNGLSGGCGEGTIWAASGGAFIRLLGARLPVGVCSFSINVTGTGAGVKNTTTELFTNSGAGGAGAATITVVAPATIQQEFTGPAVGHNQRTSLTFKVANPNPGITLPVEFTDALPEGLLVATPNGLSGGCGGGTITALPGTDLVRLSDARLEPGAACSFAVEIIAVRLNVVAVAGP